MLRVAARCLVLHGVGIVALPLPGYCGASSTSAHEYKYKTFITKRNECEY